MTGHLKAIYEGGAFRPLEAVQIAEHSEVSLLVETPDEHLLLGRHPQPA